jgi:hypothetical protein
MYKYSYLYDLISFRTLRNSSGTVGFGPHSAPNVTHGKGKPSYLDEQTSKIRSNGNGRNENSNSLEQISPWTVSNDVLILSKKEKERSKIPLLKTVITTEL